MIHHLTRRWRCAIVGCIVLALVTSASLEPALGLSVRLQDTPGTVSQDLAAALAGSRTDDRLAVLLTLKTQARFTLSQSGDRATRNRGTILLLQDTAAAAQSDLVAWLESDQIREQVDRVQPLWIFNGLALTATPDVILAAARRPEVARVDLDVIDIRPVGTGLTLADPVSTTTNLALIGVPDVWDLGIRGEGVVVATVDTGVDATHPDLAGRWRGGTNSWFDPYDPTTVPRDFAGDFSGHGTMVTGVMVAGDASGTALGVAPGAQWIAAKIFDNRGGATRSAVHYALQWLLDPDGDPLTPDAPHVVVNSWAFAVKECDLEFELDIAALRAGGILPIFAAGNYGPSPASSTSPANNPGALAVGATDNADLIYPYSSRGPSACAEDDAPYPELVAPGVGITTTARYGSYTMETGTSLAAPHVAGALALLLSAYPDMTVEEQFSLLSTTAHDLGASGPDDVFGYGRIDVLSAYQTYVPPEVHRRYLPLLVGPERRAAYMVYLPMLYRDLD